jgi:hypothetical protein
MLNYLKVIEYLKMRHLSKVFCILMVIPILTMANGLIECMPDISGVDQMCTEYCNSIDCENGYCSRNSCECIRCNAPVS